jgi:hypothetical protein
MGLCATSRVSRAFEGLSCKEDPTVADKIVGACCGAKTC